MPELPEAETIKRDLEPWVVGKTIKKVDINLPRIIRSSKSSSDVKKRTESRRIEDIRRRGKAVIFGLDSDDAAVIRLGMTGQLLMSPKSNPREQDKYDHVVFTFTDGDRMFFKDWRTFGLFFVTKKDKVEAELDLGPEPLDPSFSFDEFARIFKGTTKVKSWLMNQKRIAGIGNIYSDEILFDAGIHPFRTVESLNKKEKERLYQSIKKILNEGVKYRGSSNDAYVDAYGEKGEMHTHQKVYRRTGEPCPVCGTEVERKKMGGRSAHFCPKCQK